MAKLFNNIINKKMTKNVLTKMRSWDDNIGKLIVFAITIIIAVGVLGTLAYFYNQSRNTATQTSVLTSTSSSATDINTMWFCSSTTGNYVEYNPISNEYGMVCGGGSTDASTSKIKEVHGIIDVTKHTPALTGWALSGATATYKING